MESHTDDTAPSVEQPAVRKKRRRSRAAPLLAGIVLGVLGAIAAWFIVWAVVFREPALPSLTAADLDAAMERWERFGPAGYDLEIRVAGARAAEIIVEARDGKATRVVRNGLLLSEPRLQFPWTVPGQFDTLEQELANAQQPDEAYHAPDAQVVLRATFDGELGYPRRFQRRVLGTRHAIEWEVTRFQVVD